MLLGPALLDPAAGTRKPIRRDVRIIAHLQTGGGSADDAEDARKIYVAASRAKRLLVLAVPRNSAPKLEALLAANGCIAQRHDI